MAVKFTQVAVKAVLSANCIAFRRTDGGELRLALLWAKPSDAERGAAYCSDLEDALYTGLSMAAWRRAQGLKADLLNKVWLEAKEAWSAAQEGSGEAAMRRAWSHALFEAWCDAAAIWNGSKPSC